MDEISRLLTEQCGVIGRAQALAAGLTGTQVARRLRRGDWVVVHPGVYVDHHGPLTWQQQAWAAVVALWPAALSHESAIRAGEGPGRRQAATSVVHVAVERSRRVSAPAGVRVHRISRFEGRVQWNRNPPRMRYEEAVLEVAARGVDDLATIATLADACGSRHTTALRLLGALGERPRSPRRAWMAGVLTDVANGTCSVLEHGYLDLVERPHGLPPGTRQARIAAGQRVRYQDVSYDELGLVVELDGRLFHDSAGARDRDLERDLDAAPDRQETLRLGYGQVFGRPCSTAAKLGAVLRRRGWVGEARPCPECGVLDQAG